MSIFRILEILKKKLVKISVLDVVERLFYERELMVLFTGVLIIHRASSPKNRDKQLLLILNDYHQITVLCILVKID